MRRMLTIMPLLVLTALTGWSQVVIDIQGQSDMRTRVAVPPLVVQPGLESAAEEIAEVIAYDLAFSELFIIVPSSAYPADFDTLPGDPKTIDFGAWRETEAEQLVYGSLRREDDALVAQLRLFDLYSNQQVVGRALRAKRNLARLIGHRFTEEAIRFVDGTAGVGTSEICFSGGPKGNREIYIADYDGAHMQQVTSHESISMMPALSPNGQRIAYLSYKDRYAFLYVYDRRTGKSVPLSKEVGLNAAPAWHPDGDRLAFVLSKDGNTEIYVRHADGSNLKRLTNNKHGDTSPTWSPDGKRIAFVSERLGRPQIFSMTAAGDDVKRLSYQGSSAYDPIWSPDGKQIAYVADKSGEGFEIYVMDAATGRDWKRLTSSQGTNESPAWSPDSRHVLFTTTRNGMAELFTVHLASGKQRPVPNLDIRATAPSWGPRRD
ncbi:MAG: Tol-Pal system beta propeller repeat protein TolB [Candidatus Hydrogenedentota bacterium]